MIFRIFKYTHRVYKIDYISKFVISRIFWMSYTVVQINNLSDKEHLLRSRKALKSLKIWSESKFRIWINVLLKEKMVLSMVSELLLYVFTSGISYSNR